MSQQPIVVSAIVMHNPEGQILHVRKRGTERLMLPGGKPEPGESFAHAAMREFEEELGGSLSEASLTPLGTFRARAANEAGRDVEGHVFAHPLVSFDGPHAEIEHLEWIDPTRTDDEIAEMSQAVMRCLGEG